MKQKSLFLKNNWMLFFLTLFGVASIQAQYTTIPNPAFEKALVNSGYDDVVDGRVLTANINTVTNFGIYYDKIEDITGIEGFAALKNLTVYACGLKKVDLTQNLALESINIGGNLLRKIDLSQNLALKKVEITEHSLGTLNLQNNPNLEDVFVGGNVLVNLNMANGNNNKITRFSTQNAYFLSCIKVDNLAVTTATGTGGTPIWQVYAGTTFSTSDCGVYTAVPHPGFQSYLTQNNIAVTNNKVLTSAISGITTIDLTGNYDPVGDFTGLQDFTALTTFIYNRGGDGVYTGIDLSQNVNLSRLELDFTNAENIDLSELTKLQILKISNSKIRKIDISKNPLLTLLNCYENTNLSVLNLKGRGESSQFSNNSDFTANPKLFCIEVDDVAFATNNWINKDNTASYYSTGCPSTAIPDGNFEQALINFQLDDVKDGKVTTSNIAGIETLNISGYNIQDLTGLQDFVSLKFLDAENNQVKIIDLSKNTALISIEITNNQLKTLDVSKNEALVYLYCANNQLTKIDVSVNTSLQELIAADNPLLNANVKGNTNNLSVLNLSNTPSLTCIEVDNPGIANNNLSNNANWSKDATASFSSTCTQYTAIPDPAFEQALVDNVDENEEPAPLDDVVDGRVLTANINGIEILRLDTKGITNLTGIQDFAALTQLYCDSNILTTPVDISKNTNLISLSFYNSGLTTLDVSKNINLTDLSCDDNLLTSLDVSNNKALVSLNCGGNQLTTLDVSKNTALTALFCNGNLLTTIDVTKNLNLNSLYCGGSALTSVNIEGLTANQLSVYGSSFVGSPNLTCIKVSPEYLQDFINTPVGGANGQINKDATTSYCSDYTLISNPAFEQYIINNAKDDDDNPIDDVVDGKILTSKALSLKFLYISAPHLSDVSDLKVFTELTGLFVSHNADLNVLDISKNTKLENLTVDGIPNLDLSKNINLQFLNCANSGLTTLDVSHNTALTSLICENNQLTSLNLTSNTLLDVLRCNNNLLTSLNLSENTELSGLYCYSNRLTTLDLTKNTSLQRLICQDNLLTTVDLRNGNNTNLIYSEAITRMAANTKTTAIKGASYPIGIFGFQNNDPSLVIEVDDKVYSDANWATFKDASAVFSATALSTANNSLQNLSVFPNPTNGALFINNIPLDKVIVYGLLGNVVQTLTFDGVATSNSLDLSALSNGVYLVKITSNGVDKTVKIIKK